MKSLKWAAFGAAFLVWAGLLGAAQPANAQGRAKAPTDFSRCDGYGAPTKAGDGMTSQALELLIFIPSAASGDTTRETTAQGDAGIEACDRALADARLAPRYWMRKVNLLRARALHILEKGDHAGALAALDQAEAAALEPADPYYRRSIGLGITFIRAYALRLSGRQAEAEAMAMSAFNERPFNRESVLSAKIAIGPDAAFVNRELLARRLTQLAPANSITLLDLYFREGRFEDVVAIADSAPSPVTPSHKQATRGGRLHWAAQNAIKHMMFRAYAGSRKAYALAVLGRPDEARAAMAAARSQVEEAKKQAKEAVLLADMVDTDAHSVSKGGPSLAEGETAATSMLNETERLLDLRAKVAANQIDEVLRSMQTEPLTRDESSAEMVTLLIARLPPGERELAKQLGELQLTLRSESGDATAEGLGDLLTRLPDAETKGRIARYGGQSIWLSADGFNVKDHPEEGYVTVNFFGTNASMAIVEEMALLRAADLARQSGRRQILVIRRQDYQHSTNNMMYGTVVATYHSGFEAEIDVVLVDPQAPPQRYQDVRWRAFDADQVYQALAPVYIKTRD